MSHVVISIGLSNRWGFTMAARERNYQIQELYVWLEVRIFLKFDSLSCRNRRLNTLEALFVHKIYTACWAYWAFGYV